jgi:hypothetical protein
VFVEVVIVGTQIVVGYRAGRTSRAGRNCWFGRTYLVLLDDSFLSPNVFLQAKIPTQLVELY